MKKKTEIEGKNKLPSKTIDLLRVIQEVWSDFHHTDDNDKKMLCLVDLVYGTHIYNLIRYDYLNYKRLFIDKEEMKKEGK